jgi:hypothetical protein
MNTSKETPSPNFVAGRVCEMRTLFNGEVEFRVSGGSNGNPLRVKEDDPLWKKIKFRAHVLVVYEHSPNTHRVRLVSVKVNPKPIDIFAL